jgi:hypothetical protein
MSDNLNPDLNLWQIAARVLFSCAVTALMIVGVYFAIRWLAGAYSL